MTYLRLPIYESRNIINWENLLTPLQSARYSKSHSLPTGQAGTIAVGKLKTPNVRRQIAGGD